MTAAVWRIEPASSEDAQRRAAFALSARGLQTGDRVAVVMSNSPSMLAVVLGAMRVGIVPVVLNPTLARRDLDRLIADASPQLVVSDTRPLELGVGQADLAPVPLCRPMHYTSGTSGQPKGVWPGVLSLSDAEAMHRDEADVWQLGPGDTHLTCSPLYHSVAIRFSVQALLRGASLVLLSSFDTRAAADAVVDEGVRSTFMVPTHLQRLLEIGADVSGIRLLAHAGAPCPAALKRRLFDAFADRSVWEFYGATEGQFTVCPPDEWQSHPGTVGRARAGRTLSVDDAGQIWSAVPSFARWSYWGDAVKTAAAWRGDAFTVGDLGRLTADGFLFLDGRRDDLIITGGVNVYPAEVEQALLEIPGVVEAAVFGVQDEEWGQRVSAAVVGSASSPAVLAASRSLLAGPKRPKEVYVVDDLPRTATGKVRRSQIASWLGVSAPRDGYGAGHES